MLRIITDFDGPIMSVAQRYYQVYQFCLKQVSQPDQTVTLLSGEQFWKLKRSQVPERRIGELSGLDEMQAVEFAKLRKDTVHRMEYISLDTPIPGAIETLGQIHAAGIELVTMTMRRVRELDDAFNRYNLHRFFRAEHRYCLANDYAKTNDIADKTQLMTRAIAELPSATKTWMIGDTEADIAAAKSQNIAVIAVLSGIRDRTQLEKYEPDAIVDNLQAAFDRIQQEVGLVTTAVR